MNAVRSFTYFLFITGLANCAQFDSKGSAFGFLLLQGGGATDGPLPALGIPDESFAETGYVVHDDAAGGNQADYANALVISGSTIYAAGESWNGSDSDSTIWSYTATGELNTQYNAIGFTTHHDAGGGNGDETLLDIIVDSSGRIVAGGYTAGTGEDIVVYRYHANGSLDTGFDGDGIVTHDSLNAGAATGDRVTGLFEEPTTGGLYIAGFTNGVVGANVDLAVGRLLDDGSLDTGFAGTGFVTHNDAAGGDSTDGALALNRTANGLVQPVGLSTAPGASGLDLAVWQFDTNGNPDAGFGNNNGFITTGDAAGFQGTDVAAGTTIDGRNRILVTGSSMSTAINTVMLLWRFTADGSLDTSFGDGRGYVIMDGTAGGTNGADQGNAVAVDSLGYIYVAGYSQNADGNSDMILWRFTDSGDPDTTFAGGTGYVQEHATAGGNGDDQGIDLAIDDNGRVVVAGWSINAGGNRDMVVWRYR